VLEATGRVGGRVWSERLANGAIVERGAEFVLPGYETMRGLAARLGLGFREKGTLYGDREPRDGQPVTRDELLAAVAGLRAAQCGPQDDGQRIWLGVSGSSDGIHPHFVFSSRCRYSPRPRGAGFARRG